MKKLTSLYYPTYEGIMKVNKIYIYTVLYFVNVLIYIIEKLGKTALKFILPMIRRICLFLFGDAI